MKALLTTVGSRGDVQPLLGLAVGLRAAGHDVIVAAPPNFAAWVKGLGLSFHPVGFDIYAWGQSEPDLARSPLHATRRMTAKMKEEVPAQFRDTAAALPGVDVVVTTGIHFAAQSLAERWGVPCHYAPFVPGLLYSPSHAPALVPWMNLPKLANRMAWWGLEAGFNWLLLDGINAERARLGLKPIRDVVECFVGREVLLAVDPELSEVPADLKVPFTLTGAWILPNHEPVPADVERFLGSGPAPYFFGFGSVPDASPAETTRMFVDAVRAVGGRALISRGWANFGEEPLPEGFLAVGSLPHEKVFPRVAAVIHHGGAGTTQTTARAGVPHLVVPHGADQFYWAGRVEALGLGPRALARTKLTKDRLVAALKELASNDGYRSRANALGERLRAVDGVGNAVRYLEQRYVRRAA